MLYKKLLSWVLMAIPPPTRAEWMDKFPPPGNCSLTAAASDQQVFQHVCSMEVDRSNDPLLSNRDDHTQIKFWPVLAEF